MNMLIDILLIHLSREKQILMDPYPVRELRFDAIKLPYLLKNVSGDPLKDAAFEKLRQRYFDSLADITIDHFMQQVEYSPTDTLTQCEAVSHHLKHSFDTMHTSPEKLATLTSLL